MKHRNYRAFKSSKDPPVTNLKRTIQLGTSKRQTLYLSRHYLRFENDTIDQRTQKIPWKSYQTTFTGLLKQDIDSDFIDEST